MDDLTGIEAMDFGIGVEFVEIRHAHCKVGVGEEFNGFGFGGTGEQDCDVLFNRALLQQVDKGLSACGAFTHDDARWVEVIVEGAAFAQEFGREDDVLAIEVLLEFVRVADWDSGFNHHHGVGIDGDDVFDDGFDRARVEVVGLRIIVGGGGDDDVVSADISFLLVECRPQIERSGFKVFLDLVIDDGGFFAVDHAHLLGDDVERNHFIVLCKQDGVGESNVASSDDGNFASYCHDNIPARSLFIRTGSS